MPESCDGSTVTKIPHLDSAMASSGNVLVIDDNFSRAEDLARLVSAAGYHTEIVTDLINSDYSLSTNSELDVILCELDMNAFKDALDSYKELDAKVRDYVRDNAERMHDELEELENN